MFIGLNGNLYSNSMFTAECVCDSKVSGFSKVSSSFFLSAAQYQLLPPAINNPVKNSLFFNRDEQSEIC